MQSKITKCYSTNDNAWPLHDTGLVFDTWFTVAVITVHVCVCVSPSEGFTTSVSVIHLKCRSLLLKGHVNPLFPWGAMANVFVSNGEFLGGNMRCHCILDGLMLALCSPTDSARGSVQTCSVLDLLFEFFLFWSGVHIEPIVLSETESGRWDISSMEPIHLWVLRSPCHSFSHQVFFCLFLPPPQADGLDSGESSAKPPSSG